ncbi:MAG TPA: M23 family metallopeptidase [Lentibacillus sp.]|uniref:M23 family metallopeptidase n=1 Tax=Lentibacillus sp. TaxID=1925746 RepID=UPI002B4ADE75|nr:M23 family metallopeptidase [Lentibacillus sp.]HLR61228.1 M23 family metallopeptidase [Lentibacillus sp.]
MLQENTKPAEGASGKLGMLKKIGLTVCIGLLLTVTTVYADDNLEEIYHVYLDGEHIGKINDKTVIKNMMDAKVKEKEKDYNGFSMTIDEKVSFVSERVFNPEYNNQSVKNHLEDNLSVNTEAVELKIADESVGYFKDRKAAENVLKKYKGKYIDEDVLKQLSEKDNTNPDYKQQALVNKEMNNTTLELGDSVVTDVTLSEDVTFSGQEVAPSDVMTKKQGLKKLEKGKLEDKVHKVSEGEVLGDIADKYDLSVEEVLDLNDGLNKDSVLQIGQKINVQDYKPFVDVIVKKEELKEKTIDNDTKVTKSDELYKGDEEVKQEGQEGQKEVRYALKLKNGNVTNKEIINEKITKKSKRKIVVKGTKVTPSRGTGDLHHPTVGGHVSSEAGERWGSTHKGIDIAGPSNRSILAADNGTVVSAGYNDGGYGNKIVINHNNGMKTVYAHLSSINVSSGETVEKGSKIGVMGSTGNSTGVHLHFEVYKNGSLENPQNYLN